MKNTLSKMPALPTAQPGAMQRLAWIDILRGIAIVLMVPANLSFLWEANYPLWFRFLSSCAAPIFIMLSMGMVVLNPRGHPLGYFLKKGLVLIAFGALIDIVVWGILPFATYDVLYLIGFAIPIVFFFVRMSPWILCVIGLVFFMLTPILQGLIGYQPEPLLIYWSDLKWPELITVAKSWLIDGWFPVFPWLGLAFWGAAFFRVVFLLPEQIVPKKLLWGGSVLLVVGLILFFLPIPHLANFANGAIMENRDGYVELFYPPTLPFLMLVIGMSVWFAQLSLFLTHAWLGDILSVFGRFSLLVYILHPIFGKWIVLPLLHLFGLSAVQNGFAFAMIIFFMLLFLFCICQLILVIKKDRKTSSFILKMLIG